tara:strand:+ start:1265 stop:1696 length:432 start_codon:yes stop_codon:yes gene_type:complete
MNKNELKRALKPLIKECIKEVLFEEKGALSHIISEVANGLIIGNPKSVVAEENNVSLNHATLKQDHKTAEQKLTEHKRKLLDAIGADAYGGVNIFEGTSPAPAPAPSPQGALSGVDASDAGVDISSIFSRKSSAIFNKMKGKK